MYVHTCTCMCVCTYAHTVTQSTNTWGERLMSGNFPLRISLILSANADVVPCAQQEPQSVNTSNMINNTIILLLTCITNYYNYALILLYMYVHYEQKSLTLWYVLITIHSGEIFTIDIAWIITSRKILG